MAFNGKYDNTINVPENTVMTDNQPQYMKTLEKESGKSPNEVKVELDEQERLANDKVMIDPLNMMDVDSIENKVKEMGYDMLLNMYQNGEHEGETDEVTYDDLVAQNPGEPGFGDENFDLFAPDEQPLYQQVQSDIDKINAENPIESEEDLAPLGMDDLADIAEGEDDNPSDIEMPNDSEPPKSPDEKDETEPEKIEGCEF